jgi:zinc transport system ATP-binding protein
LTSAVTVENLKVTLGGQRILDQIDLQINCGETVGLFGANGSGKSTLVRALLGLVAANASKIELLGQPLGRLTPWHQIAYVPQTSPAGAGIPTSALEVVRAGTITGWRPWPTHGSKAKALGALTTVGLKQRSKDALRDLSGGQHRRVLLARALVRQPTLLVMDEPLAGVDAQSATALVDALSNTANLTCLVVLHEAGPFGRYLTRGIVLDEGRLVADGTLEEISATAERHHHHDPLQPHRSRTPELEVRP